MYALSVYAINICTLHCTSCCFPPFSGITHVFNFCYFLILTFVKDLTLTSTSLIDLHILCVHTVMILLACYNGEPNAYL